MLRFFVQHAPAAIAMLDREMRYLVVSERWVADFHLEDRKIGDSATTRCFRKSRSVGRKFTSDACTGAVERCEEDPFPRTDGHVDWVRWEVRPWRRN